MASEPIGDEPKQGAGSSDDNLALIGLFLLFFAISFGVGLYNGRKDLSKAENIKTFVISHTRLVHSGDTNRLVFGPSNRDVWTLDLKSNSVRLGGSMSQIAMSESTNWKTIAVDSPFLRTFLVGPVVLTVTNLVTMVKKGGDYRKIIAQIVGVGTGFSAGYWIAEHLFPPSYDDPAIIKWLSSISDSDSSEIKKRFLRNLFRNREEIAKKSAQQIIDGDSDEKHVHINWWKIDFTTRSMFQVMRISASLPNFDSCCFHQCPRVTRRSS